MDGSTGTGASRLDGRKDHSTTQYGVLGLWAASRCGYRVDPATWKSVLDYLVESQIGAAGVVPAGTGDGPAGTPRGWAYLHTSAADAPTLSMTSAGVASLLVCAEQLRRAGRLSPEDEHRSKVAIDDGLAYLAVRFSTRCYSGKEPDSRPPGARFEKENARRWVA